MFPPQCVLRDSETVESVCPQSVRQLRQCVSSQSVESVRVLTVSGVSVCLQSQWDSVCPQSVCVLRDRVSKILGFSHFAVQGPDVTSQWAWFQIIITYRN